MNDYERAFRAIDHVLSWTLATMADSDMGRMEKVDQEADKLRAYIDSRVNMLETQSGDSRFSGVPVLLPKNDLDEDRPDDSDCGAHDGDGKIMAAILFGTGFIAGALLASMLYMVSVLG